MDGFKKHRKVYETEGEPNFYFMQLTKDLIIDATRNAGIFRYINHSCDPNSIAEKCIAGSELRVEIIAMKAISKGEEINFDYGVQWLIHLGDHCQCGSSI